MTVGSSGGGEPIVMPMLREIRARLTGPLAVLPIALGATLAFAPPAAGQTSRTACLEHHYAEFADAARDYHRTVFRLLGEADTTLRDLAAVGSAVQIAGVDARQRAVDVLLQRSPQSVHVDRRVNEWLDWDRARADELSARDSVFARLEAAAREAQSRSRDHPDWTRARRVLRDSVVSKEAYREAMSRLTAAMKATPRCG